jgi:hypothetical protein
MCFFTDGWTLCCARTREPNFFDLAVNVSSKGDGVNVLCSMNVFFH